MLREITVLRGCSRSIPDDLLIAHVRHARRGNSLVIIDPSDELVERLFESGDSHIDFYLNNYDLIGDLIYEQDRIDASEAMLGRFMSSAVSKPASTILAGMLRRGTMLDEVRGHIGLLGHADIRDSLQSHSASPAAEAKLCWSILSQLREVSEFFEKPDDYARSISLSRWLKDDDCGILFVSNHSYSHPVAKAFDNRLSATSTGFTRVAELSFLPGDNPDPWISDRQLRLPLPPNPDRIFTIELSDDIFDALDELASATPLIGVAQHDASVALASMSLPPTAPDYGLEDETVADSPVEPAPPTSPMPPRRTALGDWIRKVDTRLSDLEAHRCLRLDVPLPVPDRLASNDGPSDRDPMPRTDWPYRRQPGGLTMIALLTVAAILGWLALAPATTSSASQFDPNRDQYREWIASTDSKPTAAQEAWTAQPDDPSGSEQENPDGPQ